MTTLLAAAPPDELRPDPSTAPARAPAWRADLAVFLGFAGVYATVGQWLVREVQVVGFTALDRFALALDLRHQPDEVGHLLTEDTTPLTTVLTVPFTLVGPLVRSYAAVPLVSAVAAGLVLVVLHRWLRATGTPVGPRLLVLAAVGLNPLVVQHASDGDALFVGMCLGLGAVVCLLTWRGGADVRPLLLGGLLFSLAVLTDRRILAWLLVAAVVVATGLTRTRRRPRDVEGTLAALLAPTVVVVALWTALGLLVAGELTTWLRDGSDLPGPVASAPSSTVDALGHAGTGVVLVAPLTVLVLPLLVHRWVARRDAVAAGLAALLATTVLLPVVLVATGAAEVVLLRDGVPVLLVAVLGAGWLVSRSRRASALLTLVVVLLVVALPTTWRAMATSDQQVLGAAFVDAVLTGRSQDGRLTPAGARIGYASEADMGDHLRTLGAAPGTDGAVLADPRATFAVLVRTGRPVLFRDRADSPGWQAAADDPAGSGVRYLLLSTDPSTDRLARRYPTAAAGLDPDLRVVHQTPRHVLVEVTDRRTVDPGGTDDPEVRP